MRWRSGAVLVLVLGLLGFGVVPAWAYPANDTYDGRTVIDLSKVDQHLSFNLGMYSGDEDDATVRAFAQTVMPDCADVAGPASAWFEATPTLDGWLRLRGTADYGAEVIVVSGTLDNLQGLTYCGDLPYNPNYLEVQGGTTYTILVMENVGDPWLVDMYVAHFPFPSFALSLDRFSGLDPKSGIATVRGTYVCEYANLPSLGVTLRQEKGKANASAVGHGSYFLADFSFICDGASRPWWVKITDWTGQFKSGPATVTAHLRDEDAYGIDHHFFVEGEVTLRAAKALR